MITINIAEGKLLNNLTVILGNVAYKIEGNVHNKQIKILELKFLSEADGITNETRVDVPVEDGTFTFSKGYEEMFGFFDKLEITAKQANGKTMLDSSGKTLVISAAIEISIEE